MTDKEWNEVQETLRARSDARLLIDGYKVELRIIKFRNYSVGVLPFVNGEYKSEWLLNDCEERRRFYRTISGCLASDREQERVLQEADEKEYHKWLKKNTYYEYRAVWTSLELMRMHFERENKSIEILRGEN